MKLTVFACPRTNLTDQPLPAGVSAVHIPCAGRISTPLLLATLARGADAVLVLGRQQETCRFSGAEDPARERCEAVAESLRLVGLDHRRVLFRDTHPGWRGAAETVAEQVAALAGLPPMTNGVTPPPELFVREDLDTALGLWQWLAARAGHNLDVKTWAEANCLPLAGDHRLAVGELPVLSLLGGDLFSPLSVPALVGQALEVLEHLGCAPVGVTAKPEARSYTMGNAPDTISLAALLGERRATLPRARRVAAVACGSAAHHSLVEALGYQAIDAGPDPLPPVFGLTPNNRAAAQRRLAAAEKAGAKALLVDEPWALLRWSLSTRHGSWSATRLLPLLPHQLAWLTWRQLPLTFDAVGQLYAGDPEATA